MSVPLDQLYHYIESVAEEIRGTRVIIYRFLPHGSKKTTDLTQLRFTQWVETTLSPEIYCNDQEPLNYNLYLGGENFWDVPKKILEKNNICIPTNINFRKGVSNIYDKALLLHSEKRSSEVAQYKSGQFLPVYYWSHAIIARDWFRYTKHIFLKKDVKKIFLIYNRAWAGTREYRLGFADRLILNNLVNNCVMRVNPIDSTINEHYNLHQFKHSEWRPTNVIENYFPLCSAKSHYSADFDQEDYENTDIEVVLETLFDDLRLHLTEKTLRPIAMGQPFILVGTHGSLKYLRDYGFKTFADCWDESYDMITDPVQRMNKIIDVMRQITNWTESDKKRIMSHAQTIADYNKQYFFSKKFFNLIVSELQNNLSISFDELETTNTSQQFIAWRKIFVNIFESRHALLDSSKLTSRVPKHYTRQDTAFAVAKARKYYLRSLKHTT